eukprot:CAMPEP_0197588274 /NCGR_PEP_ID=MMETSP1326-20131121/9617_1 /TAXON_ID=1155430 /ORGANISM="Genus nov. species nov., Strain RCC2288" /LENGTH=186 /DNA_ID=CAMNT_0043153085 /DNA_START=80 /DNA_END=641 /DNA_ORIENTATION=-
MDALDITEGLRDGNSCPLAVAEAEERAEALWEKMVVEHRETEADHTNQLEALSAKEEIRAEVLRELLEREGVEARLRQEGLKKQIENKRAAQAENFTAVEEALKWGLSAAAGVPQEKDANVAAAVTAVQQLKRTQMEERKQFAAHQLEEKQQFEKHQEEQYVFDEWAAPPAPEVPGNQDRPVHEDI